MNGADCAGPAASVLEIDRPTDLGTYVEPNVWMRHL